MCEKSVYVASQVSYIVDSPDTSAGMNALMQHPDRLLRYVGGEGVYLAAHDAVVDSPHRLQVAAAIQVYGSGERLEYIAEDLGKIV